MRRIRRGIAAMLRLLGETDDGTLTARFLQSAVPQHYRADLNEVLLQALERVDASCLRSFFAALAETKVRRHPGGVLSLLVRACDLPGSRDRVGRRDALREAGTHVFKHFPNAVVERPRPGYYSAAKDTQVLDAGAIRDLCLAGARLQLEAEALELAALLEGLPDEADPYRTIPEGLRQACDRLPGVGNTPAVSALWRRAAEQLLKRTERAPGGPDDKTIDPPTKCDCRHCRRLVEFCLDPTATAVEFPTRDFTAGHVIERIREEGLGIETRYSTRVWPTVLVCTKSAAGFEQRAVRHAADVEVMRTLIRLTPGAGRTAVRPVLAKLQHRVGPTR